MRNLKKTKSTTCLYALLLGSVFTNLSACKDEPVQPEKKDPVTVIVTKAKMSPYNASISYVGRLEAKESVHIAAKTSGFITERKFIEGDLVEAGDVLFKIDDAPLKAELAKAQAQVDSALSKQRIKNRDYLRAKKLIKNGTISQSDYDKIDGDYLEAQANLAVAKANFDAAQLNLNYATITSPLTGRVGETKADVGELVDPSFGELAMVRSLNPIEVAFKVDEKTFLQANRDRVKNNEPEAPNSKVEVSLQLSDGIEYKHKGYISFIDNHINLETDTIAVRASFPNDDGLLISGQYVKVIMTTKQSEQLLSVPQSAVLADQQGDYLFVVDNKNVVERRNIKLGDRLENRIFILEGLEKGEKVVIKGVQKVRQGTEVNPENIDDINAKT